MNQSELKGAIESLSNFKYGQVLDDVHIYHIENLLDLAQQYLDIKEPEEDLKSILISFRDKYTMIDGCNMVKLSDAILMNQKTIHLCKLAQMKKLEEYNELIMAVGKKYPNETRHETALRYIRNAELSDSSGSAKSCQHMGGK
jgi:antitoxin component YwqK of YwqJK toxin-antitoxin module